MDSIQDTLNKITGINGLSIQQAFNNINGTSGLTMQRALASILSDSSKKSVQQLLANNLDWNFRNLSIQESINSSYFFFDHVDDTCDLAKVYSAADTYTISCWIAKGNNTYAAICGNQDTYSDGRITFYNNDISFWDDVNDSGIAISLDPNFSTDNTWEHLIITKDDTTVTVYKNNVQVGTDTVTTGGVIALDRVGDNPENSQYAAMDGGMRDFKVITRVVTAAERATLYAGGNVDDTEIHLLMDEKSGTNVVDHSGNGYTGTLANITASTFFRYYFKDKFGL
jgi:hypothetical protein